MAPPEDSWDLRGATAPTTPAPAMPGPTEGGVEAGSRCCDCAPRPGTQAICRSRRSSSSRESLSCPCHAIATGRWFKNGVEISGFQYLKFIFGDISIIHYKESVIHYKESVIH